MPRLRIAFISDYFPPHIGGMETWTYEVARAIVRRGDLVVVYTPKISGHYEDEVVDGIRVRRFGPTFLFSSSSRFASYPHLARLLGLSISLPIRLIRERPFDAVVVTYVSMSFVGLLIRFLRIPAWAVIHGFYNTSEAIELHGIMKGLLRATIQNAALKMPVQGYIVVGNEVASALLRRGVKQSKLKLIRGGVDLEEIDSVRVTKSAVSQICFVSRIIQERRLDELLRAFASVLKSVPDALLVIVGDGPLRGQSERLASSLNIGRSVRFTGSLFGKAKIEVLKKSHILAHPSTREGMSLTIYESLACGTPVVAYDIPEIKEQVNLTGGGILVKSHDVEGLGEAIVTLIQDTRLRARLSTKGRKAVEKLRWEKVAANVIRTIGQ